MHTILEQDMNYKELLNLFAENRDKELRFEYKAGHFVETNFHITEVKNLQIKSVDCGGKSDQWNETICFILLVFCCDSKF